MKHPECHPNRKHYAHGVCEACYKRKRYYDNHDKALANAAKQRALPSRQAYMIAFRKKHYALTREADLAKNKKWRLKNKERVLKNVKAWQAKNWDRHLENQRRCGHRRRARKLGVFTYRYPGDFDELIKRFNGRCAYCKKVSSKKLTQDHIIPLSWGGHDAPWNIAPACQGCNSKKHAKFWGLF